MWFPPFGPCGQCCCEQLCAGLCVSFSRGHRPGGGQAHARAQPRWARSAHGRGASGRGDTTGAVRLGVSPGGSAALSCRNVLRISSSLPAVFSTLPRSPRSPRVVQTCPLTSAWWVQSGSSHSGRWHWGLVCSLVLLFLHLKIWFSCSLKIVVSLTSFLSHSVLYLSPMLS